MFWDLAIAWRKAQKTPTLIICYLHLSTFKKDRAIFLKYSNDSQERGVEPTFGETVSLRDVSEVERWDVSELVWQKAAVLHINLQKTEKKCRILGIKERQEEEEPWVSHAGAVHCL